MLHMGYANKLSVGRKSPLKRRCPSPQYQWKKKADDLSPAQMLKLDLKTVPYVKTVQIAAPPTKRRLIKNVKEEPKEPIEEESGKCDASTEYCDASTEYCTDIDLDHSYSQSGFQAVLKKSLPKPVTEEKGVQCSTENGTFSFQKLLSDKDALLYTGLNLIALEKLISCMEPYQLPYFKLPIGDQIVVTLMKLKLALLNADIARRIGVSDGYVSKLLSYWIPTLATHLKDLIVWLPRDVIKATLPDAFLEDFPKTTCIIDCAEVFLEKSKNLKSRGETYSQYKSHNTIKFLVGISPHGHIMFVSHAFGGRASDKFIVKNSGFLDYLCPEDELMADRGFTIQDELFPRRVKLNIPAFAMGKKLSDEAVTRTRRIATVRIHVERAIRRMKVFQILSGMLRITYCNKIDDILIICAALCNLRKALIKR